MGAVPTKKFQFNKDTPVDAKDVPAKHCGRLQYREILAAPGVDPATVGSMELYFPAGTVIELHDFTTEGHADEVHPDTNEASPVNGIVPEQASRLRQVESVDVTPKKLDS